MRQLEKLAEYVPGGMSSIWMIITLLVIVGLTLLTLHVVNRIFERAIQKRAALPLKFLHSCLNVLILVLGIYLALSQFSFTRDLSRTLLQSGSLIIAVATFAAQQALGNVISGFSISASKPCDIGQKIQVMQGGSIISEGIVKDMTMRHVVIEQYDGQCCIVPNSLIDSSVIVNTNYVENIGNFLEFEVGYETDVSRAREVILEVCQKEPRLINADSINVAVSRLTADGMVLKFTAKTKNLNDSFQACSNLRENIVKRFREEGINIPYHTVTLQR